MVSSNGVRSILDLIGSTPVVKLTKIPQKDDAEVWGKLESMNPGGSVKDRICLSMIETAERDGKLKPGGTIVEPTSGNTGIGLALVSAVKGYRLILTMPDTMSEERRSLLTAYGAKLILTPDTKGMGGAIQKAEELVLEHPDYFMPQQFNNPANPEVHRRTTAVELLKQFKRIDAFVSAVGTGGTISGVGEVLKEKMAGIKIYAVEPSASPVLSGGEPGYHHIQGIGAGFVPQVLNRRIYDEIIAVSDEDAARYARRLALEEGVFVGISSGAAAYAALQVANKLGKGSVVVTIFCDTGELKIRPTTILAIKSEMDHQEKLAACERILREYRFTQCQVTLHGEMVRIRVSPQEFQQFFDATFRECIVQQLKDVGFNFVSLDLEGLPIQPTGELDPPLARDE
jgi:cysteine synthase A